MRSFPAKVWLLLSLIIIGCSKPTTDTASTTVIVHLPTVTPSASPAPLTASSIATTVPTSAISTPFPTPTHEHTALSPSATDVTGVLTHVVQEDEVLGAIALAYAVPLDTLISVNAVTDADMIRAGTVLTIPGNDQVAPSPLAQATNTSTPPIPATPTQPATLPAETWTWHPSILTGDLDVIYSNKQMTDRFTVHYAPNSYPESDINQVTHMLTTALAHLENLYETPLAGHFDVYVAGSLFAPPDQALRGRSFSAARRIFFLHDGSGNAADQQYIAAHEMTHLFTWNSFGRPVSAMLSEGAAVYAGMALISESQHMPIDAFCAAYRQAGELPSVTTHLTFEGHIRDLPNYYTAGCFVGYLVETYGPQAFGQLYPTGDYIAAYGQSVYDLETAWIATIDAHTGTLTVPAEKLITTVDAVRNAYDGFFAEFEGAGDQYPAYLEIDAARIALLEGHVDDAAHHLDAMSAILTPRVNQE